MKALIEEWKSIKGYEGLYEISSKGRVRRPSVKEFVDSSRTGGHFRTRQSKFKRFSQGRYYSVNLYKNGRGKAFTVHRLVAEHFIPNPERKPEVNHIDEDRFNNCIENLEWVTRSENALHSVHKFRGEKSGTSKLTETDVKEIVVHLEQGLLTQIQIGQLYGVSNHVINKIKSGDNWGWLTGLSKEVNHASTN